MKKINRELRELPREILKSDIDKQAKIIDGIYTEIQKRSEDYQSTDIQRFFQKIYG